MAVASRLTHERYGVNQQRYRVSVSDTRQALRRASEEYRNAEQELERVRSALIQCVVDALKGGVPPTEVVDLSLFSAGYVRVIARDHGIPPAKGGPPKKSRRSQQARASES
jgi:hypothetical protein